MGKVKTIQAVALGGISHVVNVNTLKALEANRNVAERLLKPGEPCYESAKPISGFKALYHGAKNVLAVRADTIKGLRKQQGLEEKLFTRAEQEAIAKEEEEKLIREYKKGKKDKRGKRGKKEKEKKAVPSRDKRIEQYLDDLDEGNEEGVLRFTVDEVERGADKYSTTQLAKSLFYSSETGKLSKMRIAGAAFGAVSGTSALYSTLANGSPIRDSRGRFDLPGVPVF